MLRNAIIGLSLCTLAVAAVGQAVSPYAGQETRDIKALSPQDVDNYLNGDGMGYARAAELNHYPGPRHVLDLAAELGLTDEQERHTRAIFDEMHERAVALGRRLVDREQELDRQFADGSVSEAALAPILAEIGVLQAELRQTHLRAHVRQKALLTEHQLHQYDQLRGYGKHDGAGHEHSH